MRSGDSTRQAFAGIAAFERRVVDNLRRTFLLRGATSLAVGVALVFGALMLSAGADHVREALLLKALIELAVVASFGAWLWCGRRTEETFVGVAELLRLRGYRVLHEHRAEALGGAFFLLRLLLVPVAILCLTRLVMARELTTVVWVAAQSAGAVFFALVCALTFSGLGFVARTLAPERSRLVFALLLLGPFVLGVGLDLPHLPGALSSLLGLCLGRGEAT